MKTGCFPGPARTPLVAGLVVCILTLGVYASVAGAWPAGIDHSIFSTGSEADSTKARLGSGSEDAAGNGAPDGGKRKAKRIVGISMFGSGIFLCSWGIASWQVREYQCCPPNNTQNVIKIVAGLLLLNAGLIYLLEAE